MPLQNAGKEWPSKLIATHICKLVKSNNRDEPVIILNWKDESTDKQNTVNVHPEVEVSPNRNNYSHGDVTAKEIVRRTSNRQKKVPITRNNYFLWQKRF